MNYLHTFKRDTVCLSVVHIQENSIMSLYLSGKRRTSSAVATIPKSTKAHIYLFCSLFITMALAQVSSSFFSMATVSPISGLKNFVELLNIKNRKVKISKLTKFLKT